MLSQTEILTVMEQAVRTTLVTALPMLIAALAIGVLIAIIQATTQINEQTMAFVPKIIGILLAMLLFGGMILTNLTDYTTTLFESINQLLT
ncbi:MAG: flagellar biosynthesis protein FliQ [Ruminococcaceae bacterium]|nr:flagellar biosynthesis protein FliQ [Oscillospiraceae bacterium]